MSIDCFEDVFDYLSVRDLITLSKTCTQLHQVAGYILRQNHPRASHFNINSFNTIQNEDISSVEFSNKVYFNSEHDFQHFLNIQPKLRYIKIIHFDFEFTLTFAKTERMKETLRNIEMLRIDHGFTNVDIHERLLFHCPNLKWLRIINSKIDTDWMKHKYPKLQQFEWGSFKAKGLITFLKLNPNIRILGIFEIFLYENQQLFLNSEVSLDVLKIEIQASLTEWKRSYDCISFIVLLNKLRKRGLFKRLLLTFHYIPSPGQLNILALLNTPLLLRFHLLDMETNHSHGYKLSALENLEELIIYDDGQIIDMEACANNLMKLQRIEFDQACLDRIAPLFDRAVNLRVVFIKNLKAGNYFNQTNGIINLPVLNKKRGKLVGARKIILYVEESAYLATKWAYKKTDFGLVRMMRLFSYSHNM